MNVVVCKSDSECFCRRHDAVNHKTRIEILKIQNIEHFFICDWTINREKPICRSLCVTKRVRWIPRYILILAATEGNSILERST